MIGKIDLLDREKSGFVEKEIFQNIPLVKENGNSCIIQLCILTLQMIMCESLAIYLRRQTY